MLCMSVYSIATCLLDLCSGLLGFAMLASWCCFMFALCVIDLQRVARSNKKYSLRAPLTTHNELMRPFHTILNQLYSVMMSIPRIAQMPLYLTEILLNQSFYGL